MICPLNNIQRGRFNHGAEKFTKLCEDRDCKFLKKVYTSRRSELKGGTIPCGCVLLVAVLGDPKKKGLTK
jgi:hypothetical protein